MESYTAIYDAVRSRIDPVSSQDILNTIQMQFDVSMHLEIIKQEFCNAAFDMQRPSVLFRPRIFIDEGHWCALYGENIQDGVAAFGTSPNEAMNNFDEAWRDRLPMPKED